MTTHRTYTLTDKGHATVDQIRRGHFAVADLTDKHFGREITAAGLTGTLVGLIPAGDRTSLALIVGGAHVWTDALDADTAVEVAS